MALKERLQKIQNKAARLITRKGEDDSTILKELHWLPIEARIDFKIACHVYKCLHGLAPPYLSELIEEYKPSRTLRSSNSNLLLEHRSQTKFEKRALYFYAPKIWNSLSVNAKNCDTVQSFKSHLKTDLFKKSISFIVVCLIFSNSLYTASCHFMSHVTLFLIYEFFKYCIDLCGNFIIITIMHMLLICALLFLPS